MHFKCRNSRYGRNNDIEKFTVPDEKVDWNIDFKDYNPVKFTDKKVLTAEWADKNILEDKNAKINFNKFDEGINRVSFTGEYKLTKNGIPINPVGRTGICERGLLGKWGPNHAGDPIVTRWKRDSSGNVIKSTIDKPILQFVSIQRRDTNEWALPGGMVDKSEDIKKAIMREFLEEALDSKNMNQETLERERSKIEELFSKGKVIYQGYVDDRRNTDNAWIETTAINFHDEKGDTLKSLNLVAGDDARAIKWTDLDSSLSLYASHKDFVKSVVELHKAHW